MSAHFDFNPGGTNSPGRTETWLTPPAILESLGGHESFRFDPCAAPEPRPWPTALEMNSESDGCGLSMEWPLDGIIWLNGPYKGLAEWLAKAAHHRARGGNVIVLCFTRMDTAGFQSHLIPNADALFFIRGRLKFCRADGTPGGTAGAASMLAAMGGEAAELLRSCTYPGHFWGR